MLRGRRWLVLAIAPALAACSLIYKSDLDDAYRPSASATDAGADVGTGPVGVTEAGADGSTPVAAGCAAFPTAKFCDDFDTQLNVNDGWDKLYLNEHGTGRFDALAFSAPKSFHASLVAATDDCTYARLEKGFDSGTKPTRAVVSARIRPQAMWKGSAGILNVSLNGCGIILGMNEDAPSYSADINAQYFTGSDLQNDDRDVDGFPAPDEWTDVTFDAKAQSDGHVKLDVVFDHPAGGRDDKQIDLPQCRLGGTIFVGLGFHCSKDTHDVRYDDVRVSWE